MTEDPERSVTLFAPEPKIVVTGKFGGGRGITLNSFSLTLSEARWLRDRLAIELDKAGDV